MKFSICLFLAVLCFSSTFGLISKEGLVMLRNYQKHCAHLSGVSHEHLEMVRLDRKIYENENQEKFAVCMLKKFNIMKMDGSINENDGSYFLLTDNPASFQIGKDCVGLVGGDIGETARKIMNCLLNADIFVMDPIPQHVNLN